AAPHPAAPLRRVRRVRRGDRQGTTHRIPACLALRDVQATGRAPVTWRPAVWLVAAAVAVADQLTKWWAVRALSDGRRIEVVGSYLSLELHYNSGAAFSLLQGTTWFVTVVMIAVTVGLVMYHVRAHGRLAVVLFGVAIGGALGNLYDRLLREPGFARG